MEELDSKKEEKILSKKEIRRRKKLAQRFEEKRKKGYEKWLKKRRREIAKRKAEEIKKKESEKLKKKLQKEKELEKGKLKKKVGRPRKPGPKINYYKRNKKKNRIKLACGRKELPEFKYKIISCCNGTQNKFIGKYRSIEEAYEVFNKLKNSDKNIVFPMLIMGLGTLENSINEYILIENIDNGEEVESKLRNEYGKLVEQTTNIENWIIIDKGKNNGGMPCSDM
jgi:hypothetical protein